jgi:hypothetical protein
MTELVDKSALFQLPLDMCPFYDLLCSIAAPQSRFWVPQRDERLVSPGIRGQLDEISPLF